MLGREKRVIVMAGGNYLEVKEGYVLRLCEGQRQPATERRVVSFWKQEKFSTTSVALIEVLRELGALTGNMLTHAMAVARVPAEIKKQTFTPGRNPYRKELEFLVGEGIIRKYRVEDANGQIHSPCIYVPAEGAVRAADRYFSGPFLICGEGSSKKVFQRSAVALPRSYEETLARLSINLYYIGFLSDIRQHRLHGIGYAFPACCFGGVGVGAVIGLSESRTELAIGTANGEENAEDAACEFIRTAGANWIGNQGYRRILVILCHDMEQIGRIWQMSNEKEKENSGNILFYTEEVVREHYRDPSVPLIHKGFSFADCTLDQMILSLDMEIVL